MPKYDQESKASKQLLEIEKEKTGQWRSSATIEELLQRSVE